MAETGGVSGILGTSGESPIAVSIPEIASALDPAAAAVAIEAARSDPELAQKASAYFEKQTRLVEIQTEHLHEQRAVNLSLLKLKRLGERLRLALQLIVLIFAVAAGYFAITILREIVNSRNVVVDVFDVPPEFPVHGITGKGLATGILDELTRLQNVSHIASSSVRNLSDSWSHEIELEVPEMGISIGALERALKMRFGHDVHISGELIQTSPNYLALNVRASGVPLKTFAGPITALPSIVANAADYVYSESQPAQWAFYLFSVGRTNDAIVFAPAAFSRTSKAERPRLLTAWADALGATGQFRKAQTLFRQAISINSQYFPAYTDLMDSLEALGEEEAAWKVGVQMREAAGGRPGHAPEIDYINWDDLTFDHLAERNALTEDRDAPATEASLFPNEGLTIAELDAFLHDSAATERELATSTEDKSPEAIAKAHFVQGLLAVERGDVIVASNEMAAFHTSLAELPDAADFASEHCWAAKVLALAGHPDLADTILKSGSYVDCYRFRGDVLDHRGDWAGAQKAYAEAVALAPDLPAGYYSWGVALARHGDLTAAIEKLKEANQRGPHWADPLKEWGDVFIRQGKPKDARVKYGDAVRYAPNWKQLKEAREALAKKI